MGVGTRLKQKFEKLYIKSGGGCGCNDLAKTMDTSGPKWCRLRFDELVGKIYENAQKLRIPFSGSEIIGDLAFKPAIADLLGEAITEEETAIANADKIKEQGFNEQVKAAILDVVTGPRDRDVRWQWQPEVVEAHRRLFLGDPIMAEDAVVPDDSIGLGRGIVTLAGGLKYFPSAVVLCRMLRDLGCRLPIEVWYLNDLEFDPKMREILESIPDVKCVNGMQSVPNKPRCWGGWEAKPWAIQHSSFDEVLFLDADICPAVDPTFLFDTPEFRTQGAIAWPNWDHAVSYVASHEAYYVLGLNAPGRDPNKAYPGHSKPTDYRPWETGQLLVDKRRCWKAMELAKLLSDHSDWWFPQNVKSIINDWHSYGDTAIFPLAFEATSTPVHLVEKTCQLFGDSRGGGLHQYAPDGSVAWNHRCQPRHKVRITGENPTNGLARGDLFTQAIIDLKTKWKAVPWDWRDQTAEEALAARLTIGEWFQVGMPFDRARISLLDGGRIDGGRTHHWRIWQNGDDRRLVISSPQQAVSIMQMDPHGWKDLATGRSLLRSAPKWWVGVETELAAHVWSDIMHMNEYRLPPLMDGWLVIDIGANEGMFSHACFNRGASKVLSVEPNRLAFSRLVRNLRSNPGSMCLNNAVWRGTADQMWVSLSADGNHLHDLGGMVADAKWSTSAVMTIGIDTLLQSVADLSENSRIDLVKLDCEGSEWPILTSSVLLNRANAIVAELHAGSLDSLPNWWSVPKTRDEVLAALHDHLVAHGFTFSIHMDQRGGEMGHLWAWKGDKSPFLPYP